MERTFDDIIKALMEDETWEVPQEEREFVLAGFAWFLLDQ